jgi:hypothetical protein
MGENCMSEEVTSVELDPSVTSFADFDESQATEQKDDVKVNEEDVLAMSGDDEDDSEEEEDEEEVVEEPKDSNSKLVRKLSIRDKQISELNRSLKERDLELEQTRSYQNRIDPHDPAGSIRNMIIQQMGQHATEENVRNFLNELGTDLILEVAGDDIDDPSLRERKMRRQQTAKERAFEGRIAAMENEKLQIQQQQMMKQQVDAALAECSRFVQNTGEQFPYLAVQDTAADDLYAVADEMVRNNEFNPADPKQLHKGFELAAFRLNTIYKKEAERYSKVGSGKKSSNAVPVVAPGKNVKKGYTTTVDKASKANSGNKAPEVTTDESFDEYIRRVKRQERAKR